MKLQKLDKVTESFYSINMYNSEEDNSIMRDGMKLLASTAINTQLTERQKYCLLSYYLDMKPVYTIANELGVCQQTVYFHIRQALKKLKKISVYTSVIKGIKNSIENS